MSTDQNDGSPKESLKQLRPRPLKSISIDALEAALSKAISELTGKEYDVDVQQLNLEGAGQGLGRDSSMMTIAVSPRTYLGNSPF